VLVGRDPAGQDAEDLARGARFGGADRLGHLAVLLGPQAVVRPVHHQPPDAPPPPKDPPPPPNPPPPLQPPPPPPPPEERLSCHRITGRAEAAALCRRPPPREATARTMDMKATTISTTGKI